MPIRKPSSNADTDGPPSKIPRLNRKHKRAQLSAGPANNPVVVNGPTSPVMSEHGVIELPASIASVAGTESKICRESASIANGSTASNSIATSANEADPNLSSQAMKSPTFSDADTLVTANNGNGRIPNRFSSVQSSSYSLAETGSSYTSDTGGRARHSAFSPSGLTSIWSLNNNANVNGTDNTGSQATKKDLRAMNQVAELNPTNSHQQPSPSAATGPDKAPTSFFESDSDSDAERYQSPILSDAKTLHITRLSLVDPKTSENGIQQRKFAGIRTAAGNPGPSLSKASQILGVDIKNLHNLTPAVARNDPLHSHPLSNHPALLVPGMHAAAVASDYARHSIISAASTTETCDFGDQYPPSSQLSFKPLSIVEGPPADDEALDNLPSPMGVRGGLRVPSNLHSQRQQQSLDGLGSAGGVILKRTASAPPLRRSVRINTDDFLVRMGPGGKNFHRESVVSTPYPTCHSSVQDPTIADTGASGGPVSKGSKGAVTTTTTTGNIRFGSSFEKVLPGRNEDMLLLRLSTVRHALLTRTVILPVRSTSNASFYDDTAFFANLRKEYYRVLGPIRRFLTARTLASVTYYGPGSASSDGFDTIDFLQHLSDKKLGKRRRKWVLWARKLAESTSSHAPDPATPQPLSALLPARRPRVDSVWDDIEPSTANPPTPPLARIEFSHRFDIIKISFAVLTTLIASIAAVILWTLLGLPRGADSGPGSVYGFRNSAARLETGLVFGVMVLLLGFASLLSWVAGSWILL